MGAIGRILRSVWRSLDGWKTFIVAILLAVESYCHGHGCPGPFQYIGFLLASVGWHDVVPAVDPGDLARWGSLTVALGHKLVKAYRELRAGVPVTALLSGR